MSQVAIVNNSTLVTDADGATITNALNKVLPKFCLDWSIIPTTCLYVKKGSATNIPLKISLLDSSDVSDALAYHHMINNVPYGKAFVKTVLANGGVLLYSQDPSVRTFAQSVCHELFEILINPHCNVWATLADGVTQYAYEVCDPVQTNALTVQIETGRTFKGRLFTKTSVPIYTKVGLSDWVLPQWFNPQAIRGPFNHTNTLNNPFTVDKNGYVISLSEGTRKAVWGAAVTSARKEAITAELIAKKRIA